MALVEKGCFQSRNRAQASIMAGEVVVNGEVDTRADRTVLPEDVIALKEKSCPYVSRGGLKLAGARETGYIDGKSKVCGDHGVAAGGGFDGKVYARAQNGDAGGRGGWGTGGSRRSQGPDLRTCLQCGCRRPYLWPLHKYPLRLSRRRWPFR